jgi:hypothetical protein
VLVWVEGGLFWRIDGKTRVCLVSIGIRAEGN